MNVTHHYGTVIVLSKGLCKSYTVIPSVLPCSIDIDYVNHSQTVVTVSPQIICYAFYLHYVLKIL